MTEPVSPRRIGLELMGSPSIPEMMVWADLAECLGYESVWLTETRYTRDAITCAAAVAAATSTIGIGTAVVNCWTRGPVLNAVTFAGLDELSNGRCIAGIGPGSPTVLDRQGIRPERPLAHLREYVEIMRRLIGGERLTFAGECFRIDDVALDFRPTRSTLPVYLGVTGPRALALAGEIADGVLLNSFVSTSYTEHAIERVRAAEHAAGRVDRPVDIAGALVVSVDTDGDRARDAVRPLVATYLANFPNIARESGLPESQLSVIVDHVRRAGPAAATALITDDLVSKLTCSGTLDECVAAIEDRFQMGLDLAVLGFADGPLDWVLSDLAARFLPASQ